VEVIAVATNVARAASLKVTGWDCRGKCYYQGNADVALTHVRCDVVY
jgi:hypothetical protein